MKKGPGRPRKNSESVPSKSASKTVHHTSQSNDHVDLIPLSIDENDTAPATCETDKLVDVVKPTEEPQSWASKFQPPRKGMSLTFVAPSNQVVIETDDISSEIDYWKSTLVGSFVGVKPTLTAVKTHVEQLWNHVAKPEVLYYKRGWFYFKFATIEDSHTILHGGPWIMGNSSLILKEWSPDFHDTLDSIKIVPVWIIFPDLDPCFWSVRALSKIASAIGKPLYADPYTTDKSRISFARVLIDLDISLDLKTEVVVTTLFRVKKLAVNYEWMPYYCTHCQKIGHQTSKCKKLIPKKTT